MNKKTISMFEEVKNFTKKRESRQNEIKNIGKKNIMGLKMSK